ncbi:MAG TPA: FMN-binding negative transcriptional regulator [bacterium]|nr:FMN-binding negative transcriptional regulator [bacterium]
MYVPAHFKEERVPVLHDAIRRLGFGTVVTAGAEGLEASHLPLLVDPEPEPFGTLQGHLARANPQWRAMQAGAQALAMFLGPNAYITPSWYPTKRETGKVVPTWNYLAIHAHGEVRIFDDPELLRRHVRRLTETHEAARPAPWAVGDAPEGFIAGMLRGIVGFTMRITRLEGKWKMSQNRPAGDQAGVYEGLTADGGAGHAAVAGIMATRTKGSA